MSRSLVLGTVQLGMPYGIANISGQPDALLATNIVKTAWESNIRTYDTAQGYNASETVLSKALKSIGIASRVKIVTKLDPKLNHLDETIIEKAAKTSMDLLGVPELYGLMMHREELLGLWEKGLGETMRKLVSKGIAERIGVSVYSPDKALAALRTDGIDIVQVPSNIFDRRFENAGVFEYAERNKKQVFVRSVFLQGLALMDVDRLPKHMQLAATVIKQLDVLCCDSGVTRQVLALGYAKQAYPNSKILIGVETPAQLKENIANWKAKLPDGLIDQVVQTFNDVEEQILNPVLWGR